MRVGQDEVLGDLEDQVLGIGAGAAQGPIDVVDELAVEEVGDGEVHRYGRACQA